MDLAFFVTLFDEEDAGFLFLFKCEGFCPQPGKVLQAEGASGEPAGGEWF